MVNKCSSRRPSSLMTVSTRSATDLISSGLLSSKRQYTTIIQEDQQREGPSRYDAREKVLPPQPGESERSADGDEIFIDVFVHDPGAVNADPAIVTFDRDADRIAVDDLGAGTAFGAFAISVVHFMSPVSSGGLFSFPDTLNLPQETTNVNTFFFMKEKGFHLLPEVRISPTSVR